MRKIATFDDWVDYFRQWQAEIGLDLPELRGAVGVRGPGHDLLGLGGGGLLRDAELGGRGRLR